MKKHLLFAMLLLIAATLQAKNHYGNRADEFTLTIKYLYAADSTQAAADSIVQVAEGESYSISSPEIVGYTPDRPLVEGSMPDHDLTETVLYAVNTYTVTTKSQPEEGGTTSGGGTYDYNEEVTLRARANPDYTFLNWTMDDEIVCNTPTYTFNVTSDCTLTANYVVLGVVTHTVSVSPIIAHGTISVSPSGEVEEGTVVTLTAIPDEGYVLETFFAFNKDDVSQTVEIEEDHFIMPDFDVLVGAYFEPEGSLPVIQGDIEAPAPICDGGVLDLTAPAVSDADEQGWQMSANDAFDIIVAYEGQPLDITYNGWSLRYMASNALGEVFSNVVSITVVDLTDLTLSGDLSSCTNLACTYTVAHVGNATLTWSVSDDKAIVTNAGNNLTVLWGTKGTQQVTAVAEDPESGCSVELNLDVTVQSYINDRDVHDIVAKKHEGQPYILIYPNPVDTYKYQWYKDGVAIPGATGQYYAPQTLAAGDYQVYISFNADSNGNLFCGAFSDVLTVGGRTEFAIYPNPAHSGEQLVIVNGDNESELSIYSVDGKLVYRQTVTSGEQTLGVMLPQGIYTVQLNDGKQVKTDKIIIR